MCIPPNLSDQKGASETRARTMQTAPYSSALASATLVPEAGDTVRRSPLALAREGGPPQTGEDLLPAAGEPASDCMATVQRSYQQAGLSEQAAALATAARRASTFRVYNSRVRHWNKWCSTGGHDPYHAPVNVIADYLTYLYHKGFQTNTIAGYRTAIGSIHKGFEDGSHISNNSTLHKVVRGAFTLRPPVKRLIPQWSLTLVLRKLAEAPYEPLDKASLKHTTFKCGFLLALAAGMRSSQITALSIHPDHLVWTRNGVKLSTKLGFLAKNQTLDFTPKPIYLQEMKCFSDSPEDHTWCPVRALKFYIQKTRTVRGNCNQLFVKLVEPHNGVKPSTFASWIVQTIKSAYTDRGAPGGIHAHDVRGVSASWAKFNNTPLVEVLEAAAWKTSSTFISCYVKDIQAAESNYGTKVMSSAAAAAKS